MSAKGQKRTHHRSKEIAIGPASTKVSSFVDGFYQREFGLVQWARYAIAAIEY